MLFRSNKTRLNMASRISSISIEPVEAKGNGRILIGSLVAITAVAFAVFIIIQMRSKQPTEPSPKFTVTKRPEMPKSIKIFLSNPSWATMTDEYSEISQSVSNPSRATRTDEDSKISQPDGWTCLHFAAADGSHDENIKQFIIANDYISLEKDRKSVV